MKVDEFRNGQSSTVAIWSAGIRMRIEAKAWVLTAGLVIVSAASAWAGADRLAAALLGAAAALAAATTFAHLRIISPLRAVSTALRRLASGDHGLVPQTSWTGEIGQLWQSIDTLSAIVKEAAEIRSTQAQEGERKRRRQEEVDQLVGLFGKRVGGLLSTVACVSVGLSEASAALERSTGQAEECVGGVLSDSEQTASRAQLAVSAAEQISVRTIEMAGQIKQTLHISETALSRAEDAVGKVDRLRRTAEEIGVVLELISHIASQTNLLALNATIESVRAGEAGRGFAVVAQEVKAMASQTSLATSDISAKIEAIRSATAEVSSTIADVKDTIRDLRQSGGSATVAAQEQANAIEKMAGIIIQVSTGVGKMGEGMTAVRAALQQGSAMATDVKQTGLSLCSETGLMGEDVGSFLAAMKTFAEGQELLIHDVDLCAEAVSAASTVRGRVTRLSIAFAFFTGALAGEAGAQVELRIAGFQEPLQTRIIGPADGGVYLQLALSHGHMAAMRKTLASLANKAEGLPFPTAA